MAHIIETSQDEDFIVKIADGILLLDGKDISFPHLIYKMEKKYKEIIAKNPDLLIVLDLSSNPHIFSAGIGFLIKFTKYTQKIKRNFQINVKAGEILTLFDQLHLTDKLPIKIIE